MSKMMIDRLLGNRTCPYCNSEFVCWNWFKSPEGFGHECWSCEGVSETEEKVTDGIEYENLKKVFNHE